MSQRFNPRIEEMKQNDPVSPEYHQEAPIKDDDLYYPSFGNVRHICFSWPEGRRFFLNYAYLISGDYDAVENLITLTFSTHAVTLKGVNLQPVFFRIMSQQVRLLQCIDPRYNSIGGDRSIINIIEIKVNTSG